MNCKFPPELCTVARCSVQASRIAAVASQCVHAQCIVVLVLAVFARAIQSVIPVVIKSEEHQQCLVVHPCQLHTHIEVICCSSSWVSVD